MTSRSPLLSFFVTFALLGAGAPMHGESTTSAAPTSDDWPEIRGPERSGVSSASGLARTWQAEGPPVLWRRSLGEGFSAVVVSGERLFTMSSRDGQETVLAADEGTGATLWETAVGELFTEEFGNGPRSTPAVGEHRVYAASSRGIFVALDRATGEQRWTVDLFATFGGSQPMRGFAASPLADGDQVLIEVGGSENRGIAALDAATGETRWSAVGTKASYSSPIVAILEGVRQYIFLAGGGAEIVGLSPRGELLWSFPWTGAAIAMPVLVPPNRIFASTQLDSGAVMIEVAKGDDGRLAAREIWQSREMKNHFNSTVLVGDHLYGFDNASLRAIDVATGETAWVKRGLGKGSLVAGDGLLFVLGDRGQLVLVDANPASYVERGRIQAVDGKSWTQPALAHGRLYVRDQDELVALDLRAAGGPVGGGR